MYVGIRHLSVSINLFLKLIDFVVPLRATFGAFVRQTHNTHSHIVATVQLFAINVWAVHTDICAGTWGVLAIQIEEFRFT